MVILASGQVVDRHRAAFDDSDSESDADDPRVELASSHSSDDDVDNPGDAGSRWRKENPKQSVGRKNTYCLLGVLGFDDCFREYY